MCPSSHVPCELAAAPAAACPLHLPYYRELLRRAAHAEANASTPGVLAETVPNGNRTDGRIAPVVPATADADRTRRRAGRRDHERRRNAEVIKRYRLAVA